MYPGPHDQVRVVLRAVVVVVVVGGGAEGGAGEEEEEDKVAVGGDKGKGKDRGKVGIEVKEKHDKNSAAVQTRRH